VFGQLIVGKGVALECFEVQNAQLTYIFAIMALFNGACEFAVDAVN
jgi:hypothetical protein